MFFVKTHAETVLIVAYIRGGISTFVLKHLDYRPLTHKSSRQRYEKIKIRSRLSTKKCSYKRAVTHALANAEVFDTKVQRFLVNIPKRCPTPLLLRARNTYTPLAMPRTSSLSLTEESVATC